MDTQSRSDAGVAIVYFSASGSTHALAEAVGQGVESSSRASVRLLRIQRNDLVDGRFVNQEILEIVDSSHAVVFGSPTYMGGPSAQFKAFADASSSRWEMRAWRNKLAAGFTVGSYPAGDQLATLQYFTILASQHGMLWCGLDSAPQQGDTTLNRLGCDLGATAVALANVEDGGQLVCSADLATAQHLGKRLGAICPLII